MRRRNRCDSGQGLAEYIIIVVVVAIVVLVALRYFGVGVGSQFTDAKRTLDTVKSAQPRDDESSVDAGEDALESPRGVAESEHQPAEESTGDRSATEEDLGALADSLTEEVGVGPELARPLRINLGTLLTILFIVMAIGAFMVLRFTKKTRGGRKRTKKKKLKASRGESGQALVEFVLSVITFLFVLLGVIQLALCLNAYALVRYAAYNAARAGVVHEGDLDTMREAARLSLLAIFPRHGRADHQRGAVENYLGALLTDQQEVDVYDKPITDVRILDRTASPGGGGFSNVVTFDDPEDAPAALITVQVTHHYELTIPLVNRMLYFLTKKWYEGGKSGRWDEYSADSLAAKTDKERRGGELHDIEYRVPIVAHYTMRMQSDLVRE